MKVVQFWQNLNLISRRVPCYMEGEGGEGGDEGGESGSGGEGGGEQTYTKTQVESMMGERLSKMKQENKATAAELERIKSSANLTKEERNNLQTRINELESTFMTEKEKNAREAKKAGEKHAKELKLANEETSIWRERYTNATIERALTDAAVSAGAESPEQIQMMFKGSTTLVEDKDDDGKATGTFTPKMKVTLPVKDADNGETEELTLPVGDAINRLKAAGLHKNLFKHGGTGGTGSKGAGQGGSGGDPSTQPQRRDGESDYDYSQRYNTWRREYNLDGSPRKQEA